MATIELSELDAATLNQALWEYYKIEVMRVAKNPFSSDVNMLERICDLGSRISKLMGEKPTETFMNKGNDDNDG